MAVVESGCGGGEMVAGRPCTSQARTPVFPFSTGTVLLLSPPHLVSRRLAERRYSAIVNSARRLLAFFSLCVSRRQMEEANLLALRAARIREQSLS